MLILLIILSSFLGQIDFAETAEIAESAEISFPSQTKYSPPIITFVHGVNPYLDFFFQMSKKSDLPPIPLIRSAEWIRGIDGNF